jgi:hypothetical protein
MLQVIHAGCGCVTPEKGWSSPRPRMIESKDFVESGCHKLTNEEAGSEGRVATLKVDRIKAAIIDHTVSFIDREEQEERMIRTAGLMNDMSSSVVGRQSLIELQFLSSSAENRSGHWPYCLTHFTHLSSAERTSRVV